MLLNELLLLRRAGKGGGGGGAAGDDLGDLVEVAGPDLALVLGGGVAVLLRVELPLLELGVGRQAAGPGGARPVRAVVVGGGVAVLLGVDLPLLELGVGGHAAVLVVAGELEHGGVERVEAGERDELELVADRKSGSAGM